MWNPIYKVYARATLLEAPGQIVKPVVFTVDVMDIVSDYVSDKKVAERIWIEWDEHDFLLEYWLKERLLKILDLDRIITIINSWDNWDLSDNETTSSAEQVLALLIQEEISYHHTELFEILKGEPLLDIYHIEEVWKGTFNKQ